MFPPKPDHGRTFQVIQYFSLVYLIGITSWFLLWLTVGDKSWWMAALDTMVPCLFLPTLLLLFVFIRIRSLRALFQLLVPVLIFGTLYFPYLFPRVIKTSGDPSLSVMTYNVLYRNTHYGDVAQLILTVQPDFVTFQEIGPVMMEQLKRRLAKVYPYSIMGPKYSYGTTAIFSRHPAIDAYTLDLGAGGTAVVWETQIDQKKIKVISAHLLYYGLEGVKVSDVPEAILKGTAAQNRQAQLIVDEIDKYEGIVILGCDCNSRETSGSYRILADTLNNSARVAGWALFGKTPENTQYDRNIQHIDYVFYRGELEPFQVVTIRNSAGSDHLPVLAFFEVK